MGKTGAVTRQTVLKPLGLMTTPNPYGVFPPGALSDATNVVMRAPGRVSAAPAGTNYTADPFSPASEDIYLIAPLDNGHVLYLTYDGSFWRLFEGVPGSTQNVGATMIASAPPTEFSVSRLSWTRSRDRALFNGNYGVEVCDFMQPASSTQRSLRIAGIAQPRVTQNQFTPDAAGAIPNNVTLNYRAVITREYADGYVLKSVPSSELRMFNNFGSPATYTMYVFLPLVGLGGVSAVQAGDFVSLYRTDGLSTTSAIADAGNTYKLVSKHQVTSAEAGAGVVSLVDNQPMTAPFYTTPGEELYTNPYQEGSDNANRQPDPCKALATFKSFTFYGNLTERALWEFQVPGGINTQTVNAPGSPKRLYGLGLRTVTGTITNGSPTVTGIAASNLVGIKVGSMHSASSPFPFGSQVSAVGATTITMNANANAGAASYILNDYLEFNGNGYAILGNQSITLLNGEVTPNQSIAYDSTGDIPGVVFAVETTTPAGAFPGPTQTITVRGTNGANYSPPIPEFTASVQTISPTPHPSLLRWSKDSEPEHVPSINETFIGSGQIINMVATKDALWIACSDGIYRLSGDGGQWRVDTVAPGCILCAPRCMVNLRDVVFAYTNYGFGAITDSGFVPISDKLLRSSLPGSPFAEDAGMIMGFNPVEGEVYIRKFITDYLFVWNTTSQAFTRISDVPAHLQYITAIAWQETPGSSAPAQTVIFGLGEPSVSPALIQWNSTTAKLALQVTYHPFFGEDPFTTKQWIDMCYMFSTPGAGYLLLPACSFENFASTVPIVALQGGTEAGATCGVPRKFAIAPKIEPGLTVSNGLTNAVDFLGVSVRYVPLTLQSGARK